MKTIAALALASTLPFGLDIGMGADSNPLRFCHMSDDSDGGDFSLADLADLDVTEIEEIRFENLPAGAYAFKVAAADLVEKPNRDQEQRFIAEFKMEVVEVKAVVKKGVDPESLIGKSHTEKVYIVPEKAQEGIGRVRAFIADLGCNNKGQLKAIIDGTVEHIFNGKIVERPNKDDPSSPFASLKLEKRK